MSERITGELRGRMDTLGWYDEDGSIVFTTGGLPASDVACLAIDAETFGELCDAIDAVHKGLERENKELRHDVETWRDREGGAMEESVTERLRGLIADVNPCEIADQTLDQNLIGWSDGWRLAALMECDRIDDAVRERHAWAPESHYVMLPKDSAGESWNVGDRDEDGNTVIELKLTSSGWCVITDGGCFYRPGSCRHYHAPTVEDVLREFALACEDAGNSGPEVKRLTSEFAAKLRLAGDAE